MPERNESFLARWARLKQQSREEAASERPDAAVSSDRAAPPPLPPLEKLTLESDYSGFFHPKVDENLRRAALKRLFSDPRFNVMDGLDVYIDDYSKPSPIPPEMLAALKQARDILDWAQAQRTDETPDAQTQIAAAQPALQSETDASAVPNGPATGEEAMTAPLNTERNG